MQRIGTLNLRTQELGFVKMNTQVNKTKKISEFLHIETSEVNEDQSSEI